LPKRVKHSVLKVKKGITHMKAIIVASLLALSFATGFTCSKNQPAETSTTTTTQEQMAAPATEASPAAPADGAPAAEPTATPAAETK
jgi:hypothetical protein